MQSLRRPLQNLMRDIEPHDAREGLLLEQGAQESPLAAPQVEHAACADILQSGDHGSHALVGKADLLLDAILLAGVDLGLAIGIRTFVLQLYVLGHLGHLGHLVVTHEVVLVIVQHRHQDVEVGEQLVQRSLGS